MAPRRLAPADTPGSVAAPGPRIVAEDRVHDHANEIYFNSMGAVAPAAPKQQRKRALDGRLVSQSLMDGRHEHGRA